MTENRRERSTPVAARDEVLYYALHRCCRPSCRRREGLEVHAMSEVSGRPGSEELVALCASCHRLAAAGRFSTAELQRWKLRTMEYFEDVGAE